MEIVRENNEISFTIPDGVFEIRELQSFIDFIRFREIASQSKATQKDIDSLVEEIDQSWWKKNKDRFE